MPIRNFFKSNLFRKISKILSIVGVGALVFFGNVLAQVPHNKLDGSTDLLNSQQITLKDLSQNLKDLQTISSATPSKSLFASVAPTNAPAKNPRILAQNQPVQIPPIAQSNETQTIPPSLDCTFKMPEKPVYEAKFLSIKKKGFIAPGEAFKIQVFLENSGNTPWFSADSGCLATNTTLPIVNLGTALKRDRVSPFAAVSTTRNDSNSGWVALNRIKMESKRVEPHGIARFSFMAIAPGEEGLYREFYAPVVEGKTWMEGEGLFSMDVPVGQTGMDPVKDQYVPYIQASTNLSKLDLSGEKKILVDLSDQKMLLKIGETIIRTFPVSSGSQKHPTPPGNYSISLKQETRIAGGYPHYIMPLFMMFKKSGYGIHALPSLGNDHGVFWREALDHIGEPRSHGCIRLLPQDAEFAFNFTNVGTNLEVRS